MDELCAKFHVTLFYFFFGNAFFPLETVFRSFPFHLFALNAKYMNKRTNMNSFSSKISLPQISFH